VEIPFDVAEGGRHQLYFSGNSLTRLAEPRSLSPFTWSVDDGPTHPVDGPIAAAPEAANAGEGLYPLGAVRLEPGRHTFRLKLAAPREEPDNGYALWFDAIVARRTPEDQPCAHRRERRAGPPA
jgi:hypothetical protein